MRSNIPDNFNRKFGFRTTREERSRFSSLYGTLVYVCKRLKRINVVSWDSYTSKEMGILLTMALAYRCNHWTLIWG